MRDPSPMIPAFLCVDVEPNVRQVARHGPSSWTGYDAMHDLLGRLRTELAEASGAQPHFGWYFRMDPQIELSHEIAEYAVTAFGDRVERLAREGDSFGVHVHPFRWSDESGCWTQDFADSAWMTHCVESSFAAYERALGARPVRHRFGAHFLDDAIVAMLDDLGTRVDLTVEPGRPPARLPLPDTPMTGELPDYRHVPNGVFHPARDDYRRDAGSNGRALAIVPLSSTRARPDKPGWWRAARMIRRGLRPASLPLSPSQAWPSPERYWDLVERHLASMRRPYFALAVRTDDPGSPTMRRVSEALAVLPRHRLARRLRFVDPVDGAATLLDAR